MENATEPHAKTPNLKIQKGAVVMSYCFIPNHMVITNAQVLVKHPHAVMVVIPPFVQDKLFLEIIKRAIVQIIQGLKLKVVILPGPLIPE